MFQPVQPVHTAVPLPERIAAFTIGCFALYIAIFMYADKKKKWQEWLENIWLEIYERAKNTDTVFTALVNKVAAGTVNVLNAIFGIETFSLKLATVSANTGMCIALIAAIPFELLNSNTRPDTPNEWLGGIVVFLTLFIPCAITAIVAIRSNRKLTHLKCSIPPLVFIFIMLVVFVGDHDVISLSLVLVLTLSIVIDILSVIAVRKIFGRLQSVSSIWAVSSSSLLLGIVAFGAVGLPVGVGLTGLRNLPVTFDDEASSMIILGILNINTCIYCLVPALVLIGLVLHKSLWPILAQVTYPLLEFRVLQERRILIPIGTAALAIGLGADSVVVRLINLFKP